MAGSGYHEVKHQMETKTHQENANQLPIQTSISTVSCHDKPSQSDQVIQAEIFFATFIAKHNLPFLLSDHFTKLCKVMFLDSKIARSFASFRKKKTMAIEKHAPASALNANVVKRCRFSLSLFCVMVAMMETRNTSQSW